MKGEHGIFLEFKAALVGWTGLAWVGAGEEHGFIAFGRLHGRYNKALPKAFAGVFGWSMNGRIWLYCIAIYATRQLWDGLKGKQSILKTFFLVMYHSTSARYT